MDHFKVSPFNPVTVQGTQVYIQSMSRTGSPLHYSSNILY